MANVLLQPRCTWGAVGTPPQFRKEWVGFLDLVALWRTLEEE